jgi:hypothetical protein
VLVIGAVAPAPDVKTVPWAVLPLAVLAAIAYVQPAPSLPVVAAVTLALLLGGTFVGGLVGGRIQRAGHLMVVAYVSAVADLYSVFAPSGPSGHVAESERLLSVLAVPWPLPTRGEAVPVLGIGDVIMTALYLVAGRQLGLPPARTVAALAVAYGIVFGLLLGFRVALPALPVLGALVVLAHPRVRYLAPGDRRQAAAGMLAITVLFGALWLVR